MSLIERPHHNILYAVGKSKLANVVLIPCKLLGDQVRFARDRRSKRTLSRKADEFERDGMMSLFSSQEPREHVGGGAGVSPALWWTVVACCRRDEHSSSAQRSSTSW